MSPRRNRPKVSKFKGKKSPKKFSGSQPPVGNQDHSSEQRSAQPIISGFKDRSGKIHGLGRAKPHVQIETPSPHKKSVSPIRGKRPAPVSARKSVQARPATRDDSQSRKGTGYQVLKGTVDKNRKGFGFLGFEKKGLEDAFINPREAANLFHGDRVEATVNTRGEIMHIKVVEHRFREVVGRFQAHASKGKGGWIIYERKRAREEIFCPLGSPKAKQNDWVRAKLTFHSTGQYAVTGEITDVYGQELPCSADIGMVAAEYNLVEEHSQAAEREASTFRLDTRDNTRKDLKDVPFITIDGETARDFDDAVYVEKNQTGYTLWVAIADVSHYVTDGSALDKEARSRGTSVYFPERAFHMLPRALSENLCSLKPNEPRLAMVSKIEFDAKGKRGKVTVMNALIESRRRATYTEIQAEWEANKKNPEWEFAKHFDLYAILRKARHDRGSIDFDLPEAEVVVKPTGEPVSIKNRPRVDAHRLIEEFMIGANEAVTDWVMKQGWPFIYRVHDEPSMKALVKFADLAATAGVHFSLETENLSETLADLVGRLEGNPAQHMLNMALLRSMRQAVYSALHGIHFGLASTGYTHFTSPIRRYPDLAVHRVLKMILKVHADQGKGFKKESRDKLEKELEAISEHCSYRERIAAEAERESIKLKQVRIMIPHVGKEFDAKVVGMTDNGLFVSIPDPYVEGMINKDSMTDDTYQFNEDRMIFVGRRKKRTFKIGTPVKVQVLNANIDLRQIDFGLADSVKKS